LTSQQVGKAIEKETNICCVNETSKQTNKQTNEQQREVVGWLVLATTSGWYCVIGDNRGSHYFIGRQPLF